MKLKFNLLAFVTFISISGLQAQTCESKGPNIILFTWDGVRPSEFFDGTSFPQDRKMKKEERGELLPYFWKNLSQKGMILGERGNYKIAAPIALSLPSYQSMMTGEPIDCRSNDCSPVEKETFFERIKNELKLEDKDVAVFASWNRISRAVMSKNASIVNGIYPNFLNQSLSDLTMDQIQSDAMKDLPIWEGSRKDEYTFKLGMTYLKKHCPRVLYISLVDSDEWGHHKNYPEYTRAIRKYDEYLKELVETIDSMGEYGKNTTLLVTTDHGRGHGPLWHAHHLTKLSAHGVFLYVKGPHVKKFGKQKTKANHKYLKPTIEVLMGLSPSNKKLLLLDVLPEKKQEITPSILSN